MRVWRHTLIAMVGWCAGAAAAQMPSPTEFERAVTDARPEALALGLQLRTDALWLRMLQAQTPMMASLGPGTCHIGYTAYNPRADFSTLFPALSPADRAAWLGGFIRHELAHCADMQDTPVTTVAAIEASNLGHESGPWSEVLADLAFALHVDRHAAQGGLLIERLAALRAERAGADPSHDSSLALRCYLAQRDSASPISGDWLATLRAWRTLCLPGERIAEAAKSTDQRLQRSQSVSSPHPVALR